MYISESGFISSHFRILWIHFIGNIARIFYTDIRTAFHNNITMHVSKISKNIFLKKHPGTIYVLCNINQYYLNTFEFIFKTINRRKQESLKQIKDNSNLVFFKYITTPHSPIKIVHLFQIKILDCISEKNTDQYVDCSAAQRAYCELITLQHC